MKTLIACFLILLSTLAFGQTSVDATSQGGPLRSTTTSTLKTTGSPIIAVNINGNLTAGTLGTLSFTTPVLATGNFQTGATFGSGGGFVIDSPGYIDYFAEFSSATWSETTLANGTHYYVLSGSLVSTEGNGAFYCVTNNLPDDTQWVKSGTIQSCQFNVTLVF
jgi:hypothetical protein